MTKLSVNINKVATLRNARGGNLPNVKRFALDCERFGADGITVHPRPDERHICRADVYELKPILCTEFNIEGYPSADFMRMIKEVKPAQVTLVPDTPEQITSNHGWNVKENLSLLTDVCSQLREWGLRSSIFINPDAEQTTYAAQVGADRVELYTEPYAVLYPSDRAAAVAPYVETAQAAKSLALGVNAGHDLSLENLTYFVEQVSEIDEVSIGHCLICDALYFGIEKTIKLYKDCLITV